MDRPMSYLNKRGVTPKQASDFGLGYFPEDDWPPYPQNFDEEDVDKYWKWSFKGARLKDKLVFPLTNSAGTLMGIEVRTPSDEKKDYSKFYLTKAAAYPIFFGVSQAIEKIWDTETVFIVEGLFDIFPLHRVYANTICTCTAEVSKNQLTFLERYCKKVHVAFDQDEFGDRFFNSFYRNHRDDFDLISRVSYAGSDLNESWVRLGEQRFTDQFDYSLQLTTAF